MRILFVQTNTYRLLNPSPIGASLVARSLQKNGHEVRFLDLMYANDPAAAARGAAEEFKPELSCFSIRNRDNMMWAKYFDPLPIIRSIVEAVRDASSATILLGGTAFTTFPIRFLEELKADYGITGDDLAPISQFVSSLAQGKPDADTPGLVFRNASGRIVENPFTIAGYRGVPFDNFSLVDMHAYRKGYWQAAVVTRTGCPEKCMYCDTFHTFGADFILREPEEIVDEIMAFKKSGKVRSIFLIDAGFNRPLEFAKTLLELIIRRGAHLSLNAIHDPGQADREYFNLFRRAGGLMLTLFAESLSEKVLGELRKSFGVAEILRDVNWMNEEKVGFVFMPTFGSPGETRQTVEETLNRIPSLKSPIFDFSIGWRIQPRTELRERAIAEGLIPADDDCWKARFYVSPDTPREWLEKRLRSYKIRNLLLWRYLAPFMVRAAVNRPWKWKAEQM
jgi:anaerobic magnesium-protoporphyrin IX monomethyl ester cyclase